MGTIIEARDVMKKYGDFIANKNINFQVEQGEVRAIIGENGAGKTTLMNMLYGIFPPTGGQLYFEGEPVRFQSPKDAIHLGIGMVHQHFKLSPSLSVYENVILGIEMLRSIKIGGREIRLPLIDNKRERQTVQELIKKYNFNLDPDARIRELSIGAQQRVEILKMLYRDVKVLILDEPTAVLIPQEVDELIAKIHELKKAGQTVIIITHKLGEVKRCADNISVMRRGEMVGTVKNDDDATLEALSEMMVGRPVLLRVAKSNKAVNRKKVLLEVCGLSAKDSNGRPVVRDVHFHIYENEVLGVAGIEGNGQTELMYLLSGLMKPEPGGSVRVEGREVLGLWPDELRAAGLGIIPEDRYRQGVCLSMPVSFNLISGYHGGRKYCRAGLMNYKAVRQNRDELVDQFDIRLSGYDPPVSSLSGGNAQKVVIARELSNDPIVLLASQPTRGVDVGATEYIHRHLLALRDRGKAVLLISSELTEVKGLTDRIIVIHEGEITGVFRSDEVSFNELGLYMSGARRMDPDKCRQPLG